MPKIIGIDEAGYGPNLGPFTMSSACFTIPDDVDADLWKTLRHAVRRAAGKADGRLIVDDSKEVYSPKTGIGILEKHLGPWLKLATTGFTQLDELWQQIALTPKADVVHEPYVQWNESLSISQLSLSSTAILQGTLQQTGVTLHKLQSCIISPRQFNSLTKHADSKAAVPLHCVGQLLQSLPADETIDITIDRLGGRQRYVDPVQKWFLQHRVSIVSEEPHCSEYAVGSNIRIRFRVQADQYSFPVALASMLSKYWRELLMKQFNTWFAQQQPGITPTAGYPLDATRFWNDVAPTRQRLQLIESDWWRER